MDVDCLCQDILRSLVEMLFVSSVGRSLTGVPVAHDRLASANMRDEFVALLSTKYPLSSVQAAFDAALKATHERTHGFAPWLATKIDLSFRGALRNAGVEIDLSIVRTLFDPVAITVRQG